MKLKWDDIVPDIIRNSWKHELNEIKELHLMTTDRCVINSVNKNTNYEIVTFTDASMGAYSCAVYLREHNSCWTNTSLIFSKSRLAPINSKLSIPRLELLGVVIGCRASKYVADQLGMMEKRRKIFTDSKCVIEWINSVNKLNRFVRERVKEIKEHNVEVRYDCCDDNSADVATRGQSAENLKSNKLWWNGPFWINREYDEWPSFHYKLTNEIQQEVKCEERGTKILFENALVATPSQSEPFGINENSYSSYFRLIRITAWCMRFISNIRRKIRNSNFLTALEIADAGDMWLHYTQKRYFQDVLDALNNGKKHPLISELGLYMDSEGIIRCSGRFSQPKSHPKLLPKDSQFTRLCIVRYHRCLLHAGVSHTLAEIRKEFWELKGRSAVRRAIRQCLICLHWEGGPFNTPKFANFPDYILSQDNPPFTFIGVDYLGPIFVKDDLKCNKNWICLFTSLNARAIHLEVIDDMSTENFLLCLRRYFARRGTPSLIISDNAPNFRLGNSVINRIWKHIVRDNDVQSYVANGGIQWKFITDYAPWKGGFYERLVGLTKRSLRKSLGKSKLSNKELITIITEIEAIINSRPLTYVDADINSGYALTPSHFISLNQKTGCPNIDTGDVNLVDSSTKLIEMWKRGQNRLDNFWNVWSTEYLNVLRERKVTKLKPVKGEVRRKPEVCEIVIIKEENQPRGRCKIAKVQRLIISEIDNKHRAAQLLLPSGLMIKRPFKFIYPIEMNDETNIEEEKHAS